MSTTENLKSLVFHLKDTENKARFIIGLQESSTIVSGKRLHVESAHSREHWHQAANSGLRWQDSITDSCGRTEARSWQLLGSKNSPVRQTCGPMSLPWAHPRLHSVGEDNCVHTASRFLLFCLRASSRGLKKRNSLLGRAVCKHKRAIST
jgi:hypothetical protein